MFFQFSNSNSEVTVDKVKKSLDSKEDIVLLDVRTPEEYEEGHLAGSVLIPLSSLEKQVEQSLPKKDQMIYTYCRSGGRSSRAVAIMKEKGYVNVFSVKGGIMAWEKENYPIC